MSWNIKKQYVDERLGMHIVHLEESESGAEHRLQICIGHESCPHCGHVSLLTVDHLDPKAMIRAEIAMLEASHKQQKDYAARYGVTRSARKDAK